MVHKWRIKDDQVRRKCIDEVIARISEEDDASIGAIAAQDIIDIVAEHLGPAVYNKAIDDSKRLVQTKLIDLEIDLDVIKAAI